MRMIYAKRVKGHGSGKKHQKDDKVIAQDLKDDNRMDQQSHQNLVMGRRANA